MQTLLPLIPEGSSSINDIVSVVRDRDRWTYYIGLYPAYSHDAGDRSHFRLTIAQLVDAGSCRPCELMRVFGICKNNVLRAVRQLKERGAGSFFDRKAGRRGGGRPYAGKVALGATSS